MSGTETPATAPVASPIDGDIKVAETLVEGVATALGQPEVAAGVAAAGAVASTVADDVANHSSDTQAALDAVTKAAASAPAVIATLPPEQQAQATSGLAAASGFFAWWAGLVKGIESAL